MKISIVTVIILIAIKSSNGWSKGCSSCGCDKEDAKEVAKAIVESFIPTLPVNPCGGGPAMMPMPPMFPNPAMLAMMAAMAAMGAVPPPGGLTKNAMKVMMKSRKRLRTMVMNKIKRTNTKQIAQTLNKMMSDHTFNYLTKVATKADLNFKMIKHFLIRNQ